MNLNNRTQFILIGTWLQSNAISMINLAIFQLKRILFFQLKRILFFEIPH